MINFVSRNLDLSKFCIGQKEDVQQPPIYDLYAVINHYGGMIGGHYTAYARLPNDKNSQRSDVGRCQGLFPIHLIPCKDSESVFLYPIKVYCINIFGMLFIQNDFNISEKDSWFFFCWSRASHELLLCIFIVGWRLFDDSTVTTVEESQVVTRYAYVLFYRRRNSPVERPPRLLSPLGAESAAAAGASQVSLGHSLSHLSFTEFINTFLFGVGW